MKPNECREMEHNILKRMDESREIESIKLNINDFLRSYLNEEEGVSLTGTSSSYKQRALGIRILDLRIADKLM